MDTTTHFDIAIIGAGIAGASVAALLAPHRSVLLLEAESQPGYHSTGRSAAMFMESYGPPAVRALTRASRAFYLQPAGAFSPTPLLGARGALYVAAPEQLENLQAFYDEMAPSCTGLLRLDTAQALERASCLRPERVAAAVLDTDAMDIDVHALHQGYLRQMRKHGGVLRCNARVQSARRTATGWELSLADGEPVRAATVVNAAGAWADAVGALFGAPPIGLVPHRRSAFTFAPPAGMATSHWPVVADVDHHWYFKPDAGVLLGSPANADPTHPQDVVPEELDIATGIHHIEAVTTLTIRRPLRTWAGLRSFVPDGEMVIGADPACDGLFWVAAQGGYGIQSAPGAALLAASLLLEQPLAEPLVQHGVDPAALSPARLR
ncbi:MAG: FAD-binding oxidoreductase [Rhodoferax sp.]|nr:FAD-binding oxidoreductase [Rhodoferax sp.]